MVKKSSLLFLFLVVIIFSSVAGVKVEDASSKKIFPYPERIRYNGSCLSIEGKEIFIYSAAFHYFRTPKELWRDRFTKIKEAGFNTVETYIPWNLHELSMPKDLDDYSQIDLTAFKEWLDMAQNEFGFYTVARPGAFICAEFAGGAYPRWLAKYRPDGFDDGFDKFWLRSADDRYLDWHDHWYKAVCKLIEHEQITNKPKGQKGIILMQIENEYNHHKTKNKEYALQRMYKTTQEAGITIPIFTCMTDQTRGSDDPVLLKVFDCDNYYVGQKDAITCAKRMQSLKQKQPDAPGFVTELQGGWFSTVMGKLSEEHFSDDRHFYAISMMSIAGGSTGIFPYVYVGGTHFAGWGARGQTTTYDYNAAIRENGARSYKYYASKNVGEFINKYGSQLIHSQGGVCAFKDAPAEVVGGVRISEDGTRFVFIHNSSTDKKMQGKAIVTPENPESGEPIYNVDQHENKVLIKVDVKENAALSALPAFGIDYELEPMQTKVLIIPAGSASEKGSWWFFQRPNLKEEKVKSVRIAKAKKINEDGLKANYQPLADGVSLPEIKVNDVRYVRYRSKFKLNDKEAHEYTHLLFNTFSRDIVNVLVNGKLAPRLYPDEKWVSEVTRQRNKSFAFINETDYDNRFDIKGLLRKKDNEIVVVYENIGHEHGYFPMEELCGIRAAGLAANDSILQKKLTWEVSTDLAGIQNGFTSPSFEPKNWEAVQLDTTYEIPRKGNNIQPKGKQDAMLTWYTAEFVLPENAKENTWRLLINASGNGYIYVNGHNIGRHWEGGAQREYYIPECWLNLEKGGRNVITLGLRQTVNGAVVRAMEIASYTGQM
ncbi:beta-galactosidase [Dysgonomonas sp. 216]|uniref:beta-galactosidase n=1 Tax=Dysgonomonas sp. 216 TaxID=2302934 RepID=UPI0013D2ABFC|nr:beta-galactosidase [Dysgonomonas sp. 216]NDW17644.1 beta-galactosidase [Dysgonomonas sp. 216]